MSGSMAPKSVIGSYKNPKNKTPEDTIVAKQPQKETPTKNLSEGIQESLKQGLEESKDITAKAKSYEEILKEEEISLTKARVIVDDILCNGFYEEALPITKSTFVTFRTRSQADYKRYLRALDLYNPKYIEEQQELQMRYYIAASIVEFKGNKFSHPELSKSGMELADELFQKRLDWVDSQSERVVFLLASKLNKFDRMVSIVMSEGVVENF